MLHIIIVMRKAAVYLLMAGCINLLLKISLNKFLLILKFIIDKLKQFLLIVAFIIMVIVPIKKILEQVLLLANLPLTYNDLI